MQRVAVGWLASDLLTQCVKGFFDVLPGLIQLGGFASLIHGDSPRMGRRGFRRAGAQGGRWVGTRR